MTRKNHFLMTIAALMGLLACNAGAASNASSYESDLAKKYSSRITFESEQARSVVDGFNIDCEAQDGRYLPLKNLLFAKMSSIAKMSSTSSLKAWLVMRVEQRGGVTRITETLVGSDGPLMPSRLVFEINQWGELKPYDIRKAAIINACFGSQGEIWRMP